MKINELHESTTSGAIATVSVPMNGGDTIKRGTGVYPNKKGGNLLTGKKTNKKYANSISENSSIPIRFHTTELKPNQYRNYVIPYFEANNIDRSHPGYITNLRIMSESKYNLDETKEFEDIQPFIQTINRLDSKKTVKVGDKFAVLAFEIIYFHKEIILYGFTKPVTVTKVSVRKDGSITRIGFDNGDFYPRQPKVTLNKRSIEHAAYFDTEKEANHALAVIRLMIPDEWELDTTGLNVPFDRKGLEETLRRNSMKIKEINEEAKKPEEKFRVQIICDDGGKTSYTVRAKDKQEALSKATKMANKDGYEDFTAKIDVTAKSITEDAKKFTSKQQVIDHFVKQGKTAAQGASAWERGWRGPKPKAKTPSTAPKNAYWLDKDNVTEAELQEDDLILVPGEGHRLKSGFMPNRHGSQDHEVQMARGDLYQTMKNSEAILKMIEGRSEEVGLEGWVQAKITKASDYLNSVRQYLESKGIRETGGVIAGGGVGESKKGGQKEVDDYKKWRKDNFDDLDTTRKIVSRTPSSRNPWQDMEDAAAYAGKSFKRRGN